MKYILLGAGGHAHDVYDIFSACLGKYGSAQEVLGFLDDDTTRKFDLPDRLDVLGPICDYTKFMSRFGNELRYIVAINSSIIRKDIVKYMDSIHAESVKLLCHPTASISKTALLGKGVVIGHGAIVTSNARIGDHVHMNTHSSVNQGSTIGSFSTLSPGARVCGDVSVGECVQMGANSCIINMKTVEKNVVLGAGAVVVNNIPEGVTAKGVPAKFN